MIAHSVGTWCAFEFIQLVREKGLPLPRHMFLSAMAAPDWAPEDRPWRQQASLSEDQFKARLSLPCPASTFRTAMHKDTASESDASLGQWAEDCQWPFFCTSLPTPLRIAGVPKI